MSGPSSSERRTAWVVAMAVAAGFATLGVVWAWALAAASQVDTHRLSPQEERVLLEKREQRTRLMP